jgi:hypothetical protein
MVNLPDPDILTGVVSWPRNKHAARANPGVLGRFHSGRNGPGRRACAVSNCRYQSPHHRLWSRRAESWRRSMSVYFSLTRILGPAVKAEIERAPTCRPTVESELGLFGSLSWTKVQDEVAKFTRACACSRAGIIQSEDKDGSRDGKGVAWGLHAALTAAARAARC